MQTKHDANLDVLFLMQMLPDRDANAISMIQMSHAGMEMQSLFMMMPRGRLCDHDRDRPLGLGTAR